ncbi:hypothetical protein QBC32DRAFT_260112 [Pseudoneurospora amorphoporcata]|uniref:Uncharacterized protein n=1 Tax=Pseudoneurospora amorphoporcata TaxID=241081 RepID=A0AAN6NUS9_9PEZI|nr:hypothetical protein QBC32DRAFT_260112 [Pseudoneurospora amorphoporcata]
MDAFSRLVRLLDDTKHLEARKHVERLLGNPPSCPPPWGQNLKVLVEWATNYVLEENKSGKDELPKEYDEAENSEAQSQTKASASQHDSQEGNEVQPEEEPESKTPEQPSMLKMLQAPHLQDFWSRNPKWVTDYFVTAQRYPRLETIVRAMLQEHLVEEQNYFSTIKAHVNPESNTGEGTSPEEEDGEEKRANETADEQAGEGAEEEAWEMKAEEKAEEEAEEESEAGNKLSDAANQDFIEELQDALKQHILLKGFLDVYWQMFTEGALIQGANHMLFMKRLQTESTTASEHHQASPTGLSLVFPAHQSGAPTPSSSLSGAQAEKVTENEHWIEVAARQLSQCEIKLRERVHFLTEYDEKMRDRTTILMFKQMELLGIDERNKLEGLKLKAQEMVLELKENDMNSREKEMREKEKEMSKREKVLREREEKMGL